MEKSSYRKIALIYGMLVYGLFVGTFAYLVGFLGNVVVPKSIDTGTHHATGRALLANGFLAALFGLQHSGMARQGFKKWWTRIVPPPVERSTYVLVTSFLLMLLFWQWRPLPAVVWRVESAVARLALQVLFWCGWLIVLLSSCLIDHFDLVGLRQVYGPFGGERYRPPRFRTPGLYRCVRHPLYLGFLIAFWCTPSMTVGHVEFAAAATIYVFIGILFEERDLVRTYGDDYRRYREQVPMILPIPRSK